MNKFKKVMLGALSVLTLGLFAVVGTKVSAEEVAGTDYWELYRSGDSTVVNTSNYFTLSSVDNKKQTVTNTNGYTKHDGTALANLNRNWQIASGSAKKITFTTGDNSDGYTLEILMVGGSANSNVTLNGTALANVGTTNLEKVTSSLTKETEYTILKGANTNYIHYICVYKTIVSSNSYTLNFDSNGHGNNLDSVSDVNALTSTLLNKTITGVSGYRFDGWYMEAACTTVATTSTDLDNYASNGSVTLYAKWVQTKTISFYDPENTENAIETVTYDYNDTIDYEPTKENCSFDGWYTDVALTTEVTSLLVGDSTPETMYAKFDTLSYSGNPNALTPEYIAGSYIPTTAVTSKTNLTGLNYYLMPDLCKQTIKINNNDTNVIYLGGTGTGGKNRSLGFKSPANGTLKVKVFATGDRQWAFYDVAGEADALVTDTLSRDTVHEIQLEVSANKTYEVYCKNNKCYIVSAEFIPTTITPADNAEITVTPLVQKATDSTYTYVRFITIVSGVNEFDASDVKFDVTMKYADTNKADKTKTYTPYAVKRITSNGETYTDGTHTFGIETNQYYVVYVLRFTTASATGNKVYSTVSFNGNSYTSDLETI